MKDEWINIENAVPVLKKNQHCVLVLVSTWDKGREDDPSYSGDVETAMYFKEKVFKTWIMKPENLLDDWKETYNGTFKYDYLPDKVTHWMYLPKPPVKNGK